MRRILFVLLAACGSSTPPPEPPVPTPPPTGSATAEAPAEVPASVPGKPVKNTTLAAIGLDPTALDRTADPCEDFYQFACGGWMNKTEIPSDKPMAMRSFIDIEDRNEEFLKGVLEKARTGPQTDPVMKQLGAYYGACMDEAGREKAGLKPIKPLLATIAKVKDAKSLGTAITALHAAGIDVVFDFGPTEDFADATKVIAGIDQGGLGLPDRDYYLKDDDASKGLRAAYADLIAALLVEAGHKADVAKTEAAEIIALETELAKVSKDKVAMRDPKGLYNRLDLPGVKKALPSINWEGYYKALGAPVMNEITVSAPDFLAGVEAQMAKTKPAVWRNYLTVHVLASESGHLTKKLYDTTFAFESKLTGQPQQQPLWKRCIAATTTGLRDLVAQVFVRDRFAGESKSAAEAQIKAISAVMKQNLDVLPWMDATTKTKAYEKLTAMAYHIGYPKQWRTYTFKVDPKAHAANTIAARKADNKHSLGKLGKPVDREDWDIPASMVNAFYHPTHNKMVFPAGILQPPFYSVNASVAVNLGGMGFVVGHELTHGFDDQGSQFDAKGNLANWWQPETEKQFKQRTQCVVDQYSKYAVTGGAKVNGKLTLGENIADIGGVKLALAAYRSLRASAPEEDIADGFTEDQQFFLSAGQVWCAKLRPEFEAMLVTVDPHSPMKWRVNGTLASTPEFAKAFRCKIGTAMKPRNACVVW